MYFVFRVFFDQSGTQSNSIQKFDTLIQAQKRFWNILAADADSANIQYELVHIVDGVGNCYATQVFDNRAE